MKKKEECMFCGERWNNPRASWTGIMKEDEPILHMVCPGCIHFHTIAEAVAIMKGKNNLAVGTFIGN